MAMTGGLRCVDLPRFADTPLATEPFRHAVVPHFVRPDALSAVARDFPAVVERGSIPVGVTRFGPAFAALLADLRSPDLCAVIEDKFDVDLHDRPIMITVRGCLAVRDGRVHTDTATKLVTMLIYVNESWDAAGGRLRLLRSADDLDDYAIEVPPVDGTLVIFRPTDRSYHGHRPAIGRRRVVQVNWMARAGVKRREELRHTVSFWSKSLRRTLRQRHVAEPA
jgi:SM-20-related protein